MPLYDVKVGMWCALNVTGIPAPVGFAANKSAPNNFSILLKLFPSPSHTKICFSPHAPSRKCQTDSEVHRPIQNFRFHSMNWFPVALWAPTIWRWLLDYRGDRGGAIGWGTALQVRRSRVRFPMVSLESFIDIILLAALWPWVRLSL